MIETLAELVPLIGLLLNPITGVVTWIVARRKRRIEGIERLQKTIDLLIEKNCELTKEVLELRTQVATLMQDNKLLTIQVEQLSKKKI